MKKAFTAAFIFLAAGVFLFVACKKEETAASSSSSSTSTLSAKAQPGGTLNMGGSTTVAPIMFSAIEAYRELNPDDTVNYESVGSSNGISGVFDGVYLIGGSSKNISSSDREKGLKETRIAIDGIAVVVNSNVPIDNISTEDLAKIYTGKINNWKELGGPDHDIIITNRDEASGTHEAFQKLVVEKVFKGEKFRSDTLTVVSNGDLVQKVNTTPFSIGYCAAGYLKQVSNAKKITVDGIESSTANIKSFKYPVSRYLYVVTKGDLAEGTLAKTFLDWLLSPEGQKRAVRTADYIPVGE